LRNPIRYGTIRIFYFLEDFRLVELVAGLAAAAFFAGALAIFGLAPVLAFATGVFPVTAFLAESRREDDVVFLAVVVLDLDTAGFITFLGAAFGLGAAALVELVLAFVVAVDFEAGVFAGATFGVAGFLEIVALLTARVVDLVAAGLAALVVFVVALELGVGLVALEAGFAAGLFSLASDASVFAAFLGGNLTRPEGPLGKTRVPLSAPVAIALLSWVSCALPISTL